MTGRPITPDAVWSAVRGFGMWSMTRGELEDLIVAHVENEAFASQVIAQAAAEVVVARFENPLRRKPA